LNSVEEKHAAYWRANIKLVLLLMVFWAIPSFFCGIIFVEQLNKISIAGFPLGFWFAQQGSILIFVVIILVYALMMDKIDNKYLGDENV